MSQSSHTTSLSEALHRFQNLPGEHAKTLGELMQAIDEKGFGLLLILLALPSALPVPAAGYSTPFGLIILTIGIQMLMGKPMPVLPKRALGIKFPPALEKKVLGAGAKFLGLVEHLIRPRLRWIAQPAGRRLLSLLIIAMALLMCLPIPGTNTLPAAVIFLVGVALSEEDGIAAVVAACAGLFAIAVYAAAIFFLVKFFQDYGWDAIDVFLTKIKEFVQGLL